LLSTAWIVNLLIPVMRKFTFSLALTLFTSFTVSGQSSIKGDSIFIKVDSLKNLLSKADTLTSEEANALDEDSAGTGINAQISDQLTAVLTTASVIKYKLDSLLKHPALGIAHSKDNRLWIFSWYENTGGSWKSDINFVCYRSVDKKRYIIPTEIYEDETKGPFEKQHTNYFDGRGAGFDTIDKLPARGKQLYLAHGWGISCNTCVYEIAVVIELVGDSVNYNYPAFKLKNTDLNSYEPEFYDSPFFVLDARIGDIEKFDYDNKTQTLKFVYLTDDNTPIQQEESGKQKRIIRQLKFNGRKFIGKYD